MRAKVQPHARIHRSQSKLQHFAALAGMALASDAESTRPSTRMRAHSNAPRFALIVLVATACREAPPSTSCPPAPAIASIHEAILVAERQRDHSLAIRLVAHAREQLGGAPASWFTMVDHLERALAKPPGVETTRMELELLRDELHSSSCLTTSIHHDMHSGEH